MWTLNKVNTDHWHTCINEYVSVRCQSTCTWIHVAIEEAGWITLDKSKCLTMKLQYYFLRRSAECLLSFDWLRVLCRRPARRLQPHLVIRRVKTQGTIAWYVGMDQKAVGLGALNMHWIRSLYDGLLCRVFSQLWNVNATSSVNVVGTLRVVL